MLLRLEELLFLSASEIRVVSVQDDGDVIRIGVRSWTTRARCPGCGSWSGRVRGSFLRFLADLPVAGRQVVLRLRVRRFTCEDASCGRRTCVEQVTGLTRRHSQRTERIRLPAGRRLGRPPQGGPRRRPAESPRLRQRPGTRPCSGHRRAGPALELGRRRGSRHGSRC
ncbi:transposase [Streptomyces sp. e14]|uniref:transposase family protein n=1 Tax=Streptomyces sp. e14 TaxID=645465 RepID=UPI0001D065C5|nr:transposase [Streptomyces sp. e14]